MARNCSVCSLVPVVRKECEDRLQRRGQSLRAVAAFATDLGHPINHSSLAVHLRDHVAPASDSRPDSPDASSRSALTALAAHDVLDGWYALREKLAQRLHVDGLHDEADIVAADLSREVKDTLECLHGTEVGAVFDARVLAAAVGTVLPSYPAICHEVAQELDRLEARVLAEDFRTVASKQSA